MGGTFMENTNVQKEKPLVCSVISELQAAQVAKICQDYGLQAIIRIRPFVEISQIKKAVKAKLKESLYEPCPCGSEKKFKFCCYPKKLEIEI
jgi:uncharacterized protein YchJ